MGLAEEKVIYESLRQGKVYYFPLEQNDDSHYFVLLNKNPQNDAKLYFLCGSSQIDKVRHRYRNRSPETLVVVKKEDYQELQKDTVFNCNSRFERTVNQLAFYLTLRQLQIVPDPFPSKYIEQIIRGVKISNMIEAYVIKLI